MGLACQHPPLAFAVQTLCAHASSLACRFVWSCRNESDLAWCWRTLQDALYEAWKNEALQMPDDWSPLTSNMLDWHVNGR